MKITKIHYDGGEKGYQLSQDETRRVADVLENEQRFDLFIVGMRKKYKIPDEGYPYDPEKWDEKYAIETLFEDEGNSLFEDCEDFTESLGFPKYWMSSFAYFILYGIFFTPERVPLQVFIEQTKDGMSKNISISITEQLNRAAFDKYIDWEWERIQKGMEYLSSKAKGHSFMRPEIAKEIYSLRENDKLTFNKIADKLYKKYERKPYVDIFNENNVKQLYHRWNKMLKTRNIV